MRHDDSDTVLYTIKLETVPPRQVSSDFPNARDCKDGGRDEDACCDDAARPLVHLAM